MNTPFSSQYIGSENGTPLRSIEKNNHNSRNNNIDNNNFSSNKKGCGGSSVGF
jgi:hypothetical protein